MAISSLRTLTSSSPSFLEPLADNLGRDDKGASAIAKRVLDGCSPSSPLEDSSESPLPTTARDRSFSLNRSGSTLPSTFGSPFSVRLTPYVEIPLDRVQDFFIYVQGNILKVQLNYPVELSQEEEIILIDLLEEFCSIQYMGAPIPNDFSLRLDLEFISGIFKVGCKDLPPLAIKASKLESRLADNALKALYISQSKKSIRFYDELGLELDTTAVKTISHEKKTLSKQTETLARDYLYLVGISHSSARYLELGFQIKDILGSVVAKIIPA